mgnify:CR=1 FL=1
MVIAYKKQEDIRLTKARIRNTILLRLKAQKAEDRIRKSAVISRKLFKTRSFKQAKIIMFYKSFRGEVDTEEMIKLAQRIGKIVVVPVCDTNKTMIPCVLKRTARLLRGPYGILEPAVKKAIDINLIDLVIVPGVAFTKDGKRLGRGKGFYDRFLSKLPIEIPSIGLGFKCQILPDLPTAKYDVNIQKVIFA